jgi:hypothetical protein
LEKVRLILHLSVLDECEIAWAYFQAGERWNYRLTCSRQPSSWIGEHWPTFRYK